MGVVYRPLLSEGKPLQDIHFDFVRQKEAVKPENV